MCRVPAAAAQKLVFSVSSRNLGGAENVEALCSLEKQTAELDGSVFFSDPRLVANGFKIKLTPGTVLKRRNSLGCDRGQDSGSCHIDRYR